VSTVEEIERVIEQLPSEDFQKLAAWMDQRQRQQETHQVEPGSTQTYPHLEGSPRPASVLRDHSSFLNSYAPEDEGLYDDDAAAR
jgi:hypothetical protein